MAQLLAFTEKRGISLEHQRNKWRSVATGQLVSRLRLESNRVAVKRRATS